MTNLSSLTAFLRRSTEGNPPAGPKPTRRAFILAVTLAIATTFAPVGKYAVARDEHSASQGNTQNSANWVGTWTASPQSLTPPANFSNQTIRNIVHTTVSGNLVRVRLTNEFGTEPLVIGEVRIARQQAGSSTVAGTDRVVTFNGQASITIPAGAPALSDPIEFGVPSESNLAVSIYLPNATAALSGHSLSVQTNYASTPGNATASTVFPVLAAANTSGANPEQTPVPWYFLSGVYVERQQETPAIVTFGNSITDGYASTVNANHRYPNYLSQRILGRDNRSNAFAVLNQGISGNRVLWDNTGPNGLARFDRDVLSQPNLKYVIVLLGINDIGQPGSFQPASQAVTAEQIIAGHRQFINRAHLRGVRIYGGTLTPFEGTIFPGYFTAAGEQKRQAVNNWIRTSGQYDAVIDFDAAVRDPANPTRMLPAYDAGDHLHPNDAGYQAMANAVDLSLFRLGTGAASYRSVSDRREAVER